MQFHDYDEVKKQEWIHGCSSELRVIGRLSSSLVRPASGLLKQLCVYLADTSLLGRMSCVWGPSAKVESDSQTERWEAEETVWGCLFEGAPSIALEWGDRGRPCLEAVLFVAVGEIDFEYVAPIESHLNPRLFVCCPSSSRTVVICKKNNIFPT